MELSADPQVTPPILSSRLAMLLNQEYAVLQAGASVPVAEVPVGEQQSWHDYLGMAEEPAAEAPPSWFDTQCRAGDVWAEKQAEASRAIRREYGFEERTARQIGAIVLIGAPGSGKGTLATWLNKMYGYDQVSTGDILRQIASDDKPEHQYIRDIMGSGSLLSDEDVIDLVRTHVFEDPARDPAACTFDGFPRTAEQAEWLLHALEARNLKLAAVINLAVGQAVVKERLLGRGRADDLPEVIDERYRIHEESSKKVLDYFVSEGAPGYEIDADQSAAGVCSDAAALLERLNDEDDNVVYLQYEKLAVAA